MNITGLIKNDKDSLAKECYSMMKRIYGEDYSEIVDIFCGVCVSEIRDAENEEMLSITPEPFFVLSLPIPSNKKNITGWDETRKWKVEVTNTRNLPVEIEITRGFGTAYWSLEYDDQDVSYEKHDATHARFKTKLAPHSKRTFTYTITTYHGRREEQANQ